MAPITVRYGVNFLSREDLAGYTVAQIREEVAGGLGVPADAQARVNNVQAAPDHEVVAGSTVEFVKIAGEKGLAS